MTKSKGKSLKKKLKWVPMEICRVPLDPLQAVLSCCNQGVRGSQLFYEIWRQCGGWGPGCGPQYPDPQVSDAMTS